MVVTNDESSARRQKFCDDIAKRAGTYEYYCKVGDRRIFAHTPIGPVIWHAPWCLAIPFPLKVRKGRDA